MAGHKSVETPGKPPTPRILVETSQRPPLGAAFHRDVNRIIIGDIEYEDPFKKIKLFDITGVESKPLTLDRVPADYRPYEGCLFVSYMLLSLSVFCIGIFFKQCSMFVFTYKQKCVHVHVHTVITNTRK